MKVALLAVTLTMVGAILHAQSQAGAAAAEAAFEVASVKPSSADNNAPPGVRFSPGGLTYTGMTLQVLIRTAYRVQSSQIVGGPAWLDSSRFDIAAKAEGNPSPLEMLGMLRTLLEDRFQLRVHRETRIVPLFELVVNGRRQFGPGLKLATEGECSSPTSSSGGDAPPCGGVRNTFTGTQSGFTATSIPMSQFALALSNVVQTWVGDKTGLEGNFDFKLTWTPDQGASAPGPAAGNDNSGPPLVTAIQEQLGLKLQSTKGPVEVLVIDHAEKPSEN